MLIFGRSWLVGLSGPLIYIILSRPRSLKNLYSLGLDDSDSVRAIIEAGPPGELLETFSALFGEKAAATKRAQLPTFRVLRQEVTQDFPTYNLGIHFTMSSVLDVLVTIDDNWSSCGSV